MTNCEVCEEGHDLIPSHQLITQKNVHALTDKL